MRILTRPNLGGPTRQAVALWHAHRRAGTRTLLVVGRCEPGEDAIDLDSTGIPAVPDESLDAGDAEGVLVVPELGRPVRPLRDARAARRLRAIAARWRPDVVHTHTSKAGWLGRWAAKRARAPLVAHTYHGLVFADYYPSFVGLSLRRLERSLARRTGLLFAVSESCRAELVRYGVARDARVHPPAVETAAFASASRADARARLGLASDGPVLGFVGRLVPVKRPELFVALVERLAGLNGGPGGVSGVVFGDGPLRGELERAAGPRVRFAGSVPALAEQLGAIDLLVMPSAREGFPVAGVEAAAARIPVAGFDVPGVADLLDATGSPWRAPADGGLDALCAVVERALAAGPPRLGDRAAELVAACDPDRVAAQLADAYRNALQEVTA